MTGPQMLKVLLYVIVVFALGAMPGDEAARAETVDPQLPPGLPPGYELPEGAMLMEWRGQQICASPYRWIVQADEALFKRDQLAAFQQAVDTALAGTSLAPVDGQGPQVQVTKFLGRNGLFLLETAVATDGEELASALVGIAGYRYVEPDFVLFPCDFPQDPPNDTKYPEQWALNNTGQSGGTEDADIDAPAAWQINIGDPDGSVVAVAMDSGVDYLHPDLIDNVWTNPGEIPNNNEDDDDNGYIDDYYGWDFAGTGDCDPMDDGSLSHGTKVAGVIGAVGNNGKGVIGVCPRVKLMAVKVGPEYVSKAVPAIEYVVMMSGEGRPLNGKQAIINGSWCNYGWSNALYDAIADARDAGMLFVAAAGNYSPSNNDIYSSYPASFDLDNIIAVAATDHNDAWASYSHYGQLSVDLAGPSRGDEGTPGVLTTKKHDPENPENDYGEFGGTSCATPHVVGAAALLWSEYPNEDYAWIRQRILAGVDRLDCLVGKVATAGRLNVYNSLVSNNQPVAEDLAAEANEDEELDGQVTGSDADPGDTLTFWTYGDSTEARGTVSMNQDGSFTYDPPQDFFGADSFQFAAHDGKLWSQKATVTITVSPKPDPPVDAVDMTLGTDADTQLQAQVFVDDPDGQEAATFSVFDDSSTVGTVVMGSDGRFTYTPEAGWQGADSFLFEADDPDYGPAFSLYGTVTICVRDLGQEWREHAELTASGAADFGRAINISGDTALVGTEHGGYHLPYVHVLRELPGLGWSELALLECENFNADKDFGFSLAISGTTAVAGAPTYDGYDVNSGAAYVFEDTSAEGEWSQWQQHPVLAADNASANDYFGWSVAINEAADTIVIGAKGTDSGAGSAYVFTLSGGQWSQAAELVASDRSDGDAFGTSVAISGQTVIVGAPVKYAAYVFSPGSEGWSEDQKLSSVSMYFGASVSIDEDTVVVGAPYDGTFPLFYGAAFVYEKQAEEWVETQKLTAGDPEPSARLGEGVAIRGTTIVLSAPGVEAAYVFRKDSEWEQTDKVTGSSVPLGAPLAINEGGDTFIVGGNSSVHAFHPNRGPGTADMSCPALTGQLVGYDENPTDADALTFYQYVDPPAYPDAQYGTVMIDEADGTFTYTPFDPSYGGTDTFTFGVHDGEFHSNVSTVTINMLPQVTALGLSSTDATWEAGTIDSPEWANTTICWNKINKLVVDFDEPVTATINDIELLDPDGQPVAIENLTGSGTAQLTFELAEDQGQAQYLTRGDYTLTLFDTIKDSYENILDGESAGPGDFPSGDGSPGGDWTFTLTALPGDANGDKQVGKLDEQIVLDHWNQTVTPGDRLSGDLTGDGYVNLDDWVVVTNNMGGNLVAPRVEAFGLSSTKPTWQAGTQDSSVWTSDRSGRTAPWNTIDKLVIEFSEPVYASLEHISMTGASSGEITLDLQGSGTATLTLTVSSGYLDNDRYELILLDGIQDVDDGNALDGEPHGDEFPSGDGVAGGDWQFDLNVLKGDASLGSTNFVGQYDLDRVLDKWGQNVTPGNFLLGDLSGDGFVGQYDLDVVLDNWGKVLPGGGESAMGGGEDGGMSVPLLGSGMALGGEGGGEPESSGLSVEIVEVDNSSVPELSDYVTQDIVVSTETDWLGSQLVLETDVDGDIYQHPYGGDGPPNPAWFELFPALEFDTYVSDGSGGNPNMSAPVDLYGGECQKVFDDQLLQISWSTCDDDQTGDLPLARVTLADDATGDWSFLVTASPAEGPQVLMSGTIVDGVLVPDE